jgi:hypothetical protein
LGKILFANIINLVYEIQDFTDIGLVATPERDNALLEEDAGEGVGDALVGAREVAVAQQLALVLQQQQLDTLHRRGPVLATTAAAPPTAKSVATLASGLVDLLPFSGLSAGAGSAAIGCVGMGNNCLGSWGCADMAAGGGALGWEGEGSVDGCRVSVANLRTRVGFIQLLRFLNPTVQKPNYFL